MFLRWVLLSTLFFLFVGAAPTNKVLAEAKDELLLAESLQAHKDEDLQSASESPEAAKDASQSAAPGNATSSVTDDVPHDAQATTPSNGGKSSQEDDNSTSTYHLLHQFMDYNATSSTDESGYKLGYSVDDGKLKRFRYEERTPEGAIVGEFGYHKNGVIRGVRYAAEPGVHPKVVYEALVKFFSL
ncbi:uncharacterized protein LOC135401172 [Ornithodoros turicata]|uniref:uncharacterized protein LOC135401172 n=1 Tax=Ornithodoros turicata TaxID=34597 RepID=UPI00313878FA